MKVRNTWLILLSIGVLFSSGASVRAQHDTAAIREGMSKRVTQAERQAAADRLKVFRDAARQGVQTNVLAPTLLPSEPIIGQGDIPDYFSPTVPNWNYTPALKKFIDTLPLLEPTGINNLLQYIPVAAADKNAYPGLTPGSQSDYYEIGLVQFTQQFHSELPATTLRGYVQIDTASIPDQPTKTALTYPNGSPILDANGAEVYGVDRPRYLGPLIICRKDVPVRIKFTNYLPKDSPGGDLFIPVDTTVMGAGMGPNMAMPMMADRVGGIGATVEITTMDPHNFKAGSRVMLMGFTPAAYNGEWIVLASGLDAMHFQVTLMSDPGGPAIVLGEVTEMYTHNRATLHLHGGLTPWISDGLPHQWITPAGENTNYPAGVSVYNVPDMPDPGPGSMTFYYTNQQSARLMFYHDHSYGITRLNVYAGEAAGYLVQDSVEDALVAGHFVPDVQIPLVIQDKTFVDAATIGVLDPTWRWGTGADTDGNGYPDYNTGDLWAPHVYMPAQNPVDISGMAAMGRWHYGPWFWPPTPVANGPVPNPYFDCWVGDPTNPDPARQVDGPCTRPWEPEFMPGTPDPSVGMEHYNDTPLVNGTAYPTLIVDPKAYRFRILNAANDRFFNLSFFVADPAVSVPDPQRTSPLTEVKMVDACSTPGFPAEWPTDGRTGGVPDPATAGPDWVQIGSEGGFLPAPAVIPARPTVWNWDQTTFNMGNVTDHSLMLGPAERADVIVDFTNFHDQTLILYNDAPVAFPALDPRQDYYTGMEDMRDTGSHWPTLAGFGPNTRTVMQIVVNPTAAEPDTWVGLTALQTEWASTTGHPGVFERGQEPILVGQSAYDSAYTRPIGADPDKPFPAAGPYWGYSHIHDTSMNIETVPGAHLNIPMQPKAIHDEIGAVYDSYGRMSGKLGTEVPGTTSVNQNFNMLAYVDPPSEIMLDNATPLTPVLGDGTQIWKFTHNGVDTHPIHFHLFNVQLINRVGWDGAIRLPDANELGWKETIRMSPLEDTIVAMRPYAPPIPFKIGDSIRLLDPTMPPGATWPSTDPYTGEPVTITNTPYNFGWEYMLHCHVLSHEEMEMMRPIEFHVSPAAPSGLTAALGGSVDLAWVNNAMVPAATSLLIQRATDAAFTLGVTEFNVVDPTATTFADTTVAPMTTYYYRIRAENALGYSPWSNSASIWTPGLNPPAAPTNLVAAVSGPPLSVDLTWTDASDSESFFRVERAPVTGGVPGTFAPIGAVGANVTVYSDLTAAAGTTYAYRVFAVNDDGDSAASNTAMVTTPTIPVAPNNLRATPSAPGVTPVSVLLQWGDNSTNEAAFLIERANGAGGFVQIALVGANVTDWTDTPVSPGMTYTYRVRAVNPAGYSGYTNTAIVTTPSNLPPAAPSNVRILATGNNFLTVAWNDNSNNETGFQIQRSTIATGPWTLVTTTAANTTQYRNNGLGRRTTYYFQVRSVNGFGSSSWIPIPPVSGRTN